jgi:hypothetical protein
MPRNIESGPSAEPSEDALQNKINERVEQEEVATRGKDFSNPERDAQEMTRARRDVEAAYRTPAQEKRMQENANKQFGENIDNMSAGLDRDLEEMKKRHPEAWKKIQDRKKPWWKKIIGQ